MSIKKHLYLSQVLPYNCHVVPSLSGNSNPVYRESYIMLTFFIISEGGSVTIVPSIFHLLNFDGSLPPLFIVNVTIM